MSHRLQNYINKAINFEEQGKLIHALQFYNKAFNIDHDNKYVIIRIVGIYEKLEKFKAVEDFMERLLEEKQDDDLLLFFAQFLLRAKNYEKALDNLTLVSEREDPVKGFLMGICYFNLSDFEIAKLKFEEFIENNLNSELITEAYLYAAKSNLELKYYEDALYQLKESEKISSINWELHFVFAKLYFMRGMFYHAKESIDKSLKLDDKNKLIQKWSKKIETKLKTE